MSLIGMLEQIDLAKVLQRVEVYTKTGLCVIRQDVQWVELYFGEAFFAFDGNAIQQSIHEA